VRLACRFRFERGPGAAGPLVALGGQADSPEATEGEGRRGTATNRWLGVGWFWVGAGMIGGLRSLLDGGGDREEGPVCQASCPNSDSEQVRFNVKVPRCAVT